jgi:hypothetical protein
MAHRLELMRAAVKKRKAAPSGRPKGRGSSTTASAVRGEMTGETGAGAVLGSGPKLVHELSGTLAAITLHLRLAKGQPLPVTSAEHLDAALAAIGASRDQLTELAELLRRLEAAP